jgi:uncharacterized membrane protein YuzA (DUF378 family)
MNRTVRTATAAAEGAARSDWVVMLARLGYVAKGIVYIIVGLLAVRTAMGEGGQTTGSQGALRSVAGQPFGQTMLWLIGLGLFGYALWRFIQAGLDPEHKGTDASGLAARIGYAASGVIHAGLALYAIRLAMGDGGGGGGQQTLTSKVLANPFGQVVVGLAGLAVIGYGVKAAYRAYKRKYRDKVRFGQLDARARGLVDKAGRLGLSARAVVFGLIGVFLLRAAVQSDPSEARGLEGALDTLAGSSYGPWLLGLVAVGLVCYGVFSIVKGRYRTFPM